MTADWIVVIAVALEHGASVAPPLSSTHNICASGVRALPGDLLTTGNPDSPEFQEKLKPGDTLKAEIEGIGAMNLGVAREKSIVP